MQTFSKMRRNSTYQILIKYFLFSFGLIIYGYLGDIYVVLPPMFGVLFLLFVKFIQNEKRVGLFLLFLYLCFLELDKGISFGTTFILFLILYSLPYKAFSSWFQNNLYIKSFWILLVYIFYLLVLFVMGFFSDGMGYWVISLFVWYVFLESLVVWLNEFKI